MVQALVTFGSNLNKEHNVAHALATLRHHPHLRVLRVSPIYESVALDRSGQPSGQESFHNGALLLETDLSAHELRALLRQIEADQGRNRPIDRNGPYPLDLDIAFYDDQVLNVEGTLVPNPDITQYDHVAVPLAAIAPDWLHPQLGVTLGQIAQLIEYAEMERLES